MFLVTLLNLRYGLAFVTMDMNMFDKSCLTVRVDKVRSIIVDVPSKYISKSPFTSLCKPSQRVASSF